MASTSGTLYVEGSLGAFTEPGSHPVVGLRFPVTETYAPGGIHPGARVEVYDQEKRLKVVGAVNSVGDDGYFYVDCQRNTLRALVDEPVKKKRNTVRGTAPGFYLLVSLIFSVAVIGYFMWNGVEVLAYSSSLFTPYAELSFWEASTPWAFIIAPWVSAYAANLAQRTQRQPRSAWFATFFASASGAIGAIVALLVGLSIYYNLSGNALLDNVSSTASVEDVTNFGLASIVFTALLGAGTMMLTALHDAPIMQVLLDSEKKH